MSTATDTAGDTAPNPFGVHALVFIGGTTPQDLRTAIAATTAAGFELLEVSLHDADNLDAAQARADLDAAGLQVSCSRGLSFAADVSSDDPAVVTAGQQVLQRSLRATHEMGGTVLTGALYSALGKYTRPLTDTGRANVVGSLRELAQDAAPLGVQLGLEVCNRYETNVINTAEQALRLSDDIGADNVFVHLDSYHMNIEEDDLAAPVRLVGDRLGYVHVGENHRGYLGSGHVSFPQLFDALAAIG